MESSFVAAELVAQGCRVLGKLGVTHSLLGHVSHRIGRSDRMLIRAKGPLESGLSFTRARDVIEVDFEGDKVVGSPDLWPPGESFIHIAIYEMNPEVKSVIHVHPREAVLLSICDKELYPIYGAYGIGNRIANEGLRVYPDSLVVTDRGAGANFATFLGNSKAALMYGHGATVIGSSVQDAVVNALALDEYVSMMYDAYAIGVPNRLPEDQLARLRAGRDPSIERGTVAGTAGMMSFWRFYCDLAGEKPELEFP